MIAHLKGKLVHKEAAQVIIEANGIGYQVQIPLSTYTALENTEECKIFTHLVVREDAHLLFGFFTMLEKMVFLDLIGISGVGPSTGLMALSSLKPSEIKKAIATEDVKMVQSIKGVGAKTAQRIVLELKDKYQKEGILQDNETESLNSNYNSLKEEALKALVTLGINKNAAEKSINQILKKNPENITLESLIKLALKSY